MFIPLLAFFDLSQRVSRRNNMDSSSPTKINDDSSFVASLMAACDASATNDNDADENEVMQEESNGTPIEEETTPRLTTENDNSFSSSSYETSAVSEAVTCK
jgi:hypothetical protein